MRTPAAFAVLMLAATGANAAAIPVTDAQLVSVASAVMAVKEPPLDRMLGVHKGVPVIVDVRCGDVCPAYTVRIIHYTIEAGPACSKLGGDTAMIAVPAGIGVVTQNFCVPHVLYKQNLHVDHPYKK